MPITTEHFLLVGSILLFVSLIAGKTGYKFGVPTLLLFLIVGMFAGTDGLGLQFDSPFIAQAIGVFALVIILFSGGMDTKIQDIKPVMGEGIILATLGVLLTSAITGFFIYEAAKWFFPETKFTLLEALLLASVMSSTDSASVFSILRSKGIHLKERLRPLLELESGSNDPMAFMLTITLIQVIQMSGMEGGYGKIILLFFLQIIIGAIAGILLGKLFVKINNKIDLQNDALYVVLMLASAFFIFSFTSVIYGNGYLAVYLGGLIIGNKKFVHKRSISKFFDGLTRLSQILMFLTLGLLVNPHELIDVIGIGLCIGFFMILLSRPISVFISLLPFRKLSFKARTYVSWVGLRGAVPIIFAMYPWISGLENSKLIFNIVFFITILSLVIQGTTVGKMADWLGVSDKTVEKNKQRSFEEQLPDANDLNSKMSEIIIQKDNLKFGNRLMDMPFSEGTLAIMLKRKEQYIIPSGKTEIQVGDILIFITTNQKELEKTLQQLEVSEVTEIVI
ncbi:MAG: potassium/proton antiporter [Bacteroidales bacterium]|nr:potassium/proton antiporter [Bacteroidales bacterium]